MRRLLCVASCLLAGVAEARITLPMLTAAEISASCEQALTLGAARAQQLAQGRVDGPVLHGWDRMMASVENTVGPVYILAYVHPDKTVRDAGEACIVEYTQFETSLYQDEALYAAISDVEPQDAIDAKLKQDLLIAFADAGVSLPPERRQRAAAILTELQSLGQRFARNIRENNTKLTFSGDELGGLPASYLEQHDVQPGGSLTVGFDYPDYGPFMRSASNESARQRYYTAFNRRGGAENLELLDRIVELRHEYAGLHGLESYAEFVLQRRMVGSVARLDRFLTEVGAVTREAEAADVARLRAMKAEDQGRPLDEVQLKQWDRSYYIEQYRQATAQVDQEALRAYFPTLAVRDWILAVTATQYGLRFEPADVPVWHEDVVYYDVIDQHSGERLSGLYLDLFPRQGKFKHAAAFPVRGASTLQGRTPISVLVTNFDRNGLTQGEVETFFHEFGHGVHGVLSRTRYVSHAGTSVERDFVEAPSQMFEEWARRPESLALLQAHCTGCPVLGEDQIRRLDVARRLASGMRYARQHLYASFDFQLYQNPPQSAQALWEQMTAQTPYGYAPETQFPGAFSHIAGGYASGYYGYMWSEAIALDMLSAFGTSIVNPQVGLRFRNLILARGSEQSADAMVRSFLGRAPSNATFFDEIRGQRSAIQ